MITTDHADQKVHNPGHDSHDLDACIRAATAGAECVVEFGSMFGDRIAACEAAERWGVEIHHPYYEEAVRRHHPRIGFIRAGAEFVAKQMRSAGQVADAILLVDFLEHLSDYAARALIDDCRAIARRIVLFIPLGPHPQTADVFGMGGDHWQTHRSTWEPADLEALGFDVAVWDGYHAQPGKDSRAAFCVWEARCES